jgi:ATP-dependent exoDNAse (exonuclease V) alpha subunit
LAPLAKLPAQTREHNELKTEPSLRLESAIYDRHGQQIYLDPEQVTAVEMVVSGKSCVITGNAGTGKTTTSQAIFLALMEHKRDTVQTVSYRVAGGAGARWDGPSIACVAASNKAVRNMRKKVLSHPTLKEWLNEALNITTVHNLLEYTRSSTYSEEKGKDVMIFVPTRTAHNPLDIDFLIVEEASMIGAGENTIWQRLWEALPAKCQIIFMGDICQIPPVGGKPILSYALQSLPIVELKTIHRQALENPIIRQAYACLNGKPIKTDLINDGKEGVLVLNGQNVKGRISTHQMKSMLQASIPKFIESGLYNPDEDIFLCPFNVSDNGQLGNEWLNALIASYLAKKQEKEVYEIKTGFNTVYLAVGDRVMINKTEGRVLAIRRNANYIGRMPALSSKTMDYWGNDYGSHVDLPDADAEVGFVDEDDWNLDSSYEALDIDVTDKKEEVGRAASHVVEAELDDGTTVVLNGAGHFSPQVFSLGYAISIHKAQGSEWPKVFIVLHDSHRTMLYRELLYTAMTRAERQLVILAQQHTLDKAAKNPRIKGNNLRDKIEFFNGGYLDQNVPLPINAI